MLKQGLDTHIFDFLELQETYVNTLSIHSI